MSIHIHIPADTKEHIADDTQRKPIANQTCFHFTRRHTLFDSWLNSYDSFHPIVDIGCAQGQHTLDALSEDPNVHVIACDPIKDNITELLQQSHREGHDDRLKVAVGGLPRNLPRELLGPSSVSSVLCSEVLHFLPPEDLERSIRTFHDILVVNGHLHLTLLADTAAFIQICEMLPHGLEQFGHWMEHKCFATDIQKLIRMDKLSGMVVAKQGEFDESMYETCEPTPTISIETQMDFKRIPPIAMYMYSLSYVRAVLIESGFAIISTTLSSFIDYPMSVTNGKIGC